MPAQAIAVKKNRLGRGSRSKMRDNEDALAPLRNSEVLSVKHSPGDTVPEFRKSTGEGVKIVCLLNVLVSRSSWISSGVQSSKNLSTSSLVIGVRRTVLRI